MPDKSQDTCNFPDCNNKRYDNYTVCKEHYTEVFPDTTHPDKVFCPVCREYRWEENTVELEINYESEKFGKSKKEKVCKKCIENSDKVNIEENNKVNVQNFRRMFFPQVKKALLSKADDKMKIELPVSVWRKAEVALKNFVSKEKADEIFTEEEVVFLHIFSHMLHEESRNCDSVQYLLKEE